LHALGASSSATPRRAAALLAKNPTKSSCTTADVGAKAPHSVVRGSCGAPQSQSAATGSPKTSGYVDAEAHLKELDDLETGPAGGPSTRSAFEPIRR
jgi:hypothetical protein